MMVAAIAIIFVKSRVTAILLNGVLGYSIALFFVFFRAPDLALTQIVVETVTTALFLIMFLLFAGMEAREIGSSIKSGQWNYCCFS